MAGRTMTLKQLERAIAPKKATVNKVAPGVNKQKIEAARNKAYTNDNNRTMEVAKTSRVNNAGKQNYYNAYPEEFKNRSNRIAHERNVAYAVGTKKRKSK